MSDDVEKLTTKTNSSTYNTQPAGLEKALDEFFNKKIGLKLPEGGRVWLSKNAWWLALLGGVFSLWSVLGFWRLGHTADRFVDFANQLSQVYGGAAVSHHLGFMWYIALVAMLVQGVILLLAVSPLKAMKKVGWNWLFYSMLLSVVLGVVELFVPGYGFGSLIGLIIGSLIGGFLLFQTRAKFAK